MIYGVQRIVKFILGRDIAGRDLSVYADDTFIVSYPRSGNTWTRFLVANLLHPDEPANFANIERLVPDSEAQSCRYFKSISRPRLIKSHQYFDPRYKKVIYIVRDPRDVALSYYDFQRKYRQIEDGYPLSQYVEDFVGGRLSSADWGTWGENVGSWVPARQKNPGAGGGVIGSGSWGGWRKRLGANAIAAIESMWGPRMTRLGYALVTGQGLTASSARSSSEPTGPGEESLHPSLRGEPLG